MQVIRHLEASERRFRSPVATLGNFDGVHRGHQEILSRVVRQARERRGEAVVITFFPHPDRRARSGTRAGGARLPARAPAPISRSGRRRRSPATLHTGVRRARCGCVHRALSHASPERGEGRHRAQRELRPSARRKRRYARRGGCTAGFRSRGGRTRHGGRNRREQHGGPRALGGRRGRWWPLGCSAAATRWTDMSFAGDRRGQELGFPTANVRPRTPVLVPDGVYAVHATWNGERRDGVANVGRNPTFGQGRERTLEAHLFEFRRGALRSGATSRVRRTAAGRDEILPPPGARRADPRGRQARPRGPEGLSESEQLKVPPLAARKRGSTFFSWPAARRSPGRRRRNGSTPGACG